MNYPRLISLAGLLSWATIASAQVTFTFDDLADGQLSTQYQAQGATFNFPRVGSYPQPPGFAHSGTKAIELCFAAEFCKSPLDVDFTTGQARVSIFVGFTSALSQPNQVVLRALDQNGVQVAQATAALGPSTGPIPINVPLQVVSSTPNIRKISIGFGAADAFNNGLVFDDLSIDTAGPTPVCTATQNPQVTLNAPPPGTTVQINDFLLGGNVTTQTLLDQATLTVTGPGGVTKVSDFLGTFIQPTGGPFGSTHVDESLFPGSNTVTVAARNCRGTGSASTTVTYAPVANGTTVKLLRMEITQATQNSLNDVPLIAGKPTFVRLYLSTTGTPSVIKSVSGEIDGFSQGGNTPFLAQSISAIDIDASSDVASKRLDLTKSLNFNLSPDFYQRGILHFRVARLHVEGPGGATLTCSNCSNWTASFNPARPLTLVVVPYFYTHSNLTADNGTSLFGGLNWLNNVYPLTGNFPSDLSGINLTVLPLHTTGFILPRDNDRMLSELQTILNDLKSQSGSTLPADARILGIAPSGSGGVAYTPGDVAFGDSRALESASFPKDDPENYGAIWAQELAHSFGLPHVSTSHGEMPPSDANFPYPHGGIGEPGLAIGTEAWNGSPFVLDPGNPASNAKHAHDFMSYGMPNDSQDHTYSWVSPYTYRNLAGKFTAQANVLAHAASIENIVVGGTIDADGTAQFRAFHRVFSGYATGSGKSGKFSIELLDAAGHTLTTHLFDARPIEDSSLLAFTEFVPWKTATAQIVLKRNKTVLAKRVVSAHKPWVRIVRPRAGEIWSGAKATVRWQAGDADNDTLTYSVFYNSGRDKRWVPLATDVTGKTATIDTALLAGSKRARIRVRASDGVNSSEADSSGVFIVPDQAPVVAILGVANGQTTTERHGNFSGAAYDPKSGMLPAANLKWASDRDGALGSGSTLKTRRPLSMGKHVITLTATNSAGRSSTKRVNIVVR